MADIAMIARCILTLVAAGLGATAALAENKPRVASINVCTDQLVLALAEPAQIVGLSPYSRDADRSYSADQARRYRRLSGEAEDVLILRPDIVLSSDFTRRATRELLQAKGFRIESFPVAQTIGEARAQILRMGEVLGQADRARTAAERLDAAVARASHAATASGATVLPLARRGWVSGQDTMIGSLLAAVGLRSAAREGALRYGGFASLEQIVAIRPDLILVDDARTFAEDQGRAFLLHPVLERLYPMDRRLVVPERLSVCGGPMLADALDRLAAELARVTAAKGLSPRPNFAR